MTSPCRALASSYESERDERQDDAVILIKDSGQAFMSGSLDL